ncbi:hypothetical protein IPdc08_01610 [archaeon]|nr:hypothetical protein IPdc08_01610 [archaeon]
MFFLKYNGKLLFHCEICDFNSLISDKELDIKEDKSLVRRLFGRLQSSTVSKVKKINRVLVSILKGQRTLPEIMSNNSALDFLRHGLLKVHKKTNTSIDFPEITLDMDNLYSLPAFKGRLEDLFMIIESSGLLKKGQSPFFIRLPPVIVVFNT